MEAMFQAQVVKAISEGNIIGALAWGLTFWMLYRQLKGIRAEAQTMNQNFTKSLADGEKRFEHLEDNDIKIEGRLSPIETFLKGLGYKA